MTTPKSASSRQGTPNPKGSRRRTSLALDRVISGRIKKLDSPKKYDSPKGSPGVDSSYHDEDSSILHDVEKELEADRYEEMMEERKLFPGSDAWAPDEEKLFRILFMRQYSPLMPTHWWIDFRGIPLPEILFSTSEVDRPVVYSHMERDIRGKTPKSTSQCLETSGTG